MNPTSRACSSCRHWLPASGECRASFPQVVGDATRWPVTKPDDFCGRFNPAVGNAGTAPKVSDEALIKMVRDWCEPFTTQDGESVRNWAMKRTILVNSLMEMGMSRTPALKRIETMVRRGIFRSGDYPFPERCKAPQPGLHIWIDESQPEEKSEEKPDVDNFLPIVRSIAFNEENAMSMRAIHREIEKVTPMSIATVSRKMAPLVGSGEIVKCEAGYYAPMAIEAD
jgi:hypothetical protein